MDEPPGQRRRDRAGRQTAAHGQGERIADLRPIAGVAGGGIRDPRQQHILRSHPLQKAEHIRIVPGGTGGRVIAGIGDEHGALPGIHRPPDGLLRFHSLGQEPKVMPHRIEPLGQPLCTTLGQSRIPRMGHDEVRPGVRLVDPRLTVEHLHAQHPRQPLHLRRFRHDAFHRFKIRLHRVTADDDVRTGKLGAW